MKNLRADTVLVHAGRRPFDNHGIVNPPVYHCSTVLFPTLDALEERDRHPFEGVNYGRIGTPTSFAFEDAVAELEGGYRAVNAASGLAAITTALTAFTSKGDHILIADSVYGPTRRFCNETLSNYGVIVEYFDPRLAAADLAKLMRPQTRVVFLESPGSLTFEVQDVPALAKVAHDGGAVVLMDNTWGTPIGFRAFDHGVDVSIHAATKYIVGHADAMLGVMVCTKETFLPIKKTAVRLGTAAGPDDLYLGLRGLRTLSARLRIHQENGLALADYLARRPEVTRVLHPGRPGDPGHALWKRDFHYACGLFAVAIRDVPRPALTAMLDHLELFGMGYSWGGFESLILPVKPAGVRSATSWEEPGILLRLHAGLENIDDLIRDLEAGFTRMAKAL